MSDKLLENKKLLSSTNIFHLLVIEISNTSKHVETIKVARPQHFLGTSTQGKTQCLKRLV
jgi:hypothetical protein